ncbi:MAG: hypothetical protein AAB471_01220 [Patescibacteria group bacterium]
MFEKYLKIIKDRISASSDRDPQKEVILPERDWQRVIVLFIVINIFVAFLNASFFYYINNDDTFTYGGGIDASISSTSRNKIEKAILYLKEKEAKENYLLSHRPEIADPSR